MILSATVFEEIGECNEDYLAVSSDTAVELTCASDRLTARLFCLLSIRFYHFERKSKGHFCDQHLSLDKLLLLKVKSYWESWKCCHLVRIDGGTSYFIFYINPIFLFQHQWEYQKGRQ